ncbi:hypothetical protein ABZ345_36285 [Lentzea sp. NPDC005914]|uniref:hypothetical protein n=1 Tax=Lentzea sp. NPDC005914 TaxID=3154572 RepID=UPI0033E24044
MALPPQQLTLKLTESAFAHDAALTVLGSVRELGVRVAHRAPEDSGGHSPRYWQTA